MQTISSDIHNQYAISGAATTDKKESKQFVDEQTAVCLAFCPQRTCSTEEGDSALNTLIEGGEKFRELRERGKKFSGQIKEMTTYMKRLKVQAARLAAINAGDFDTLLQAKKELGGDFILTDQFKTALNACCLAAINAGDFYTFGQAKRELGGDFILTDEFKTALQATCLDSLNSGDFYKYEQAKRELGGDLILTDEFKTALNVCCLAAINAGSFYTLRQAKKELGGDFMLTDEVITALNACYLAAINSGSFYTLEQAKSELGGEFTLTDEIQTALQSKFRSLIKSAIKEGQGGFDIERLIEQGLEVPDEMKSELQSYLVNVIKSRVFNLIQPLIHLGAMITKDVMEAFLDAFMQIIDNEEYGWIIDLSKPLVEAGLKNAEISEWKKRYFQDEVLKAIIGGIRSDRCHVLPALSALLSALGAELTDEIQKKMQAACKLYIKDHTYYLVIYLIKAGLVITDDLQNDLQVTFSKHLDNGWYRDLETLIKAGVVVTEEFKTRLQSALEDERKSGRYDQIKYILAAGAEITEEFKEYLQGEFKNDIESEQYDRLKYMIKLGAVVTDELQAELNHQLTILLDNSEYDKIAGIREKIEHTKIKFSPEIETRLDSSECNESFFRFRYKNQMNLQESREGFIQIRLDGDGINNIKKVVEQHMLREMHMLRKMTDSSSKIVADDLALLKRRARAGRPRSYSI